MSYLKEQFEMATQDFVEGTETECDASSFRYGLEAGVRMPVTDDEKNKTWWDGLLICEKKWMFKKMCERAQTHEFRNLCLSWQKRWESGAVIDSRRLAEIRKWAILWTK